jgi:AhpD family alkylhydroperoxidase
MKRLLAIGFALVVGGVSVQADEPPQWMQQVFADHELQAAWEEYQTVYNHEDAALDSRTKHLIALAVAAQVPCDYCVIGHTMGAEADGASAQEIREAVAVAAQVRKLSTMLNGLHYDMDAFRAELGAPATD